MRSTRSAGWIGGTVVLILLIFVATWFLVAGPRFEAASTTLADAADVRARNVVLETQNAKLREDFAKLDDSKAELATLQTQIPTDAQLSNYLRTVDELATAAGVFVLEVNPGTPQIVTIPTPVVTVAPAAEPTTEATPAAPSDGTAEPAAADPAVPEQIDGFVAVPLVLKVVGPYANVSAFLLQLQTGPARLFLTVVLEGTSQDVQAATGGVPDIAAGDLELTITGFTYVLVDPQSAAADGTGTTEGEQHAAPVLPGSDRNPLAPLTGGTPPAEEN